MNYKVDWKKAPNIKGATLIGHAFNSLNMGMFLWMVPRGHENYDDESSLVFYPHSEPSYIKKPIGLRWQDSFLPAPRKKK